MEILLGCDPEVFGKDKEGRFISSHDLIQGTKANPFRVPLGAYQVDGVAFEFNIDPAATREEFTRNISVVMNFMEEAAKASNPDVSFVLEPTATFSEEYFIDLPEEAKLLGCEPDYSAYTLGTNPKPSTNKPQRTAGGHIHVGWDNGLDFNSKAHMELCGGLVRQYDALLFLSSLLWDDDQNRRKLYGKVGAFRPKSFGVEYRPLSNRWLSKKSIQEFIYDATIFATKNFFEGIVYEEKEYVREMLQRLLDNDYPSSKEIVSYLRELNRDFDTPLFIME